MDGGLGEGMDRRLREGVDGRLGRGWKVGDLNRGQIERTEHTAS